MHYFGSREYRLKLERKISRSAETDLAGFGLADKEREITQMRKRDFCLSLRKAPLTIVVSADYQLVLAIVAFEILLESDFAAPPANFEQLSVSFVQLVANFAIFALVHIHGVHLENRQIV
jgi:hypothetical protein